MSVRSNILLTLCASSALLGTACAGTPDGSAAGASSALGDAPRVVAPSQIWEAAPAGCEGLLPHEGVAITGADGAPELRVAFGPGGALCTDTVAALGVELRLRGLVIQPTSNDGQPAQAFPVYALQRNDEAAGDPSPQPSQPARYVVVPTTTATVNSPTMGDPSPQPSSHDTSHSGTAGDPSPQPSQPRDATHS